MKIIYSCRTNAEKATFIAGYAFYLGYLHEQGRFLALDANTNNPYWVTTENGHHYLIDDDGTIQNGRFKGQSIDGLKNYWQKDDGERQGISRWDSQKNKKSRSKLISQALTQLNNGASQVSIPHLRDDLQYYGGSNTILIPKGIVKPHNKGYGIAHITDKHGADAVKPVLETVANGEIKRFNNIKKTVCIQLNGYEAVLSLMKGKRQQTWLLTGYDIIE